jgi:hypothetical protein
VWSKDEAEVSWFGRDAAAGDFRGQGCPRSDLRSFAAMMPQFNADGIRLI